MIKDRFKKYYWTATTRWRMFKGRQLPAWLKYASILAHTKRKRVPRPDGMDRHMLLLAGHFPPEVSGGIYRAVSFASRVSEAGWKVSVITDPRPNALSEAGRYMESLIPEAVRVHRLPAIAIEWHPWPLPDVDRGIVSTMAVYEAGCAVISDTSTGVIVATGPPFHNFIAGMWLARRFGWRLVLDYRDEWTENAQGFTKKDKVNRNWEIKCLKTADVVIFTTKSQVTHQTKVFQQLCHEKCAVIYNGWEPEDFISDKRKTAEVENHKRAKKTIAFFGNLGDWYRAGDFLEQLAKVFSAHPDLSHYIKLQFVGQVSPKTMYEIDQFPYQEAVSIVNLVPKREACLMMQDTDTLLLLNPPQYNRYISGKIYEYIASGTPILLFGEGGEMEKIIKELDVGIVVPYGDAQALEEALRSIGSHVSSQGDKVTNWLNSRTREAMASRMLNLLETLREPFR